MGNIIDYRSRARLEEQRRSNSLVSAMKDSISSSLKSGGNEETLRLVVKREEDQQANEYLGKIGQAIAKIYGKIPATITLPKIFQVQGNVNAKVVSIPDLKVTNLSDLQPYFAALEKRLGQMATAISMIAATSPPTPKEIKIPEFDSKSIIEAIDRIPSTGGMSQDVVDKLNEISEGIAALYNRPQMTPQPVTNVSVNAISGQYNATLITVSGIPTPLPSTNIANRRSLIIYNNSGVTVYIGGATVAASGTGQGLPIPTGTYSPPFDAGSNMVMYGIVSSGTATVNVLETSDNNIGR